MLVTLASSPDPPAADSALQAPVLLLDAATGRVLRRFELPSDTQWSPMAGPHFLWEDSSHVLAALYSTDLQGYVLLRLGLDGSVEQVDVSSQP